MDLSRRNFMKAAAAGVFLSLPGCSQAMVAEQARRRSLNFVFILIDDMGWMDCGCNGSTFYETPNIDRLAKEGMRFTDAYAAGAVCSPTRAALMSGKYPARLKITDWIPGNPKQGKLARLPIKLQLPLSEVTFPETLKEADYRTAFLGKWHLGKEGYFPEDQGFDVNIGGHHRGSPPGGYFSPYNNPKLSDGPEGEYLPDRLTSEAIEFIKQYKDDKFFVMLSYYTVHSPVQAKKETIEKYKIKAKKLAADPDSKYVAERDVINREIQDHPAFAAMIEHMDENVGRVADALKDMGLDDNTVVVFTSDNGGQSILYSKAWGSNRPLRAGKGWHYEGGIRVPMIVKWPGVVKGGSECDEPVMTMDYYPTILEMAGLPPKPDQHMDGRTLVPLLKQKGSFERKAIFWHYPHYHGSGHRPSGAVRMGDWKLIEFFEDMNVELYNLKDDLREDNDLSEKYPERTEQLRSMLHQWRTQIGAEMPKPNPKWKARDSSP